MSDVQIKSGPNIVVSITQLVKFKRYSLYSLVCKSPRTLCCFYWYFLSWKAPIAVHALPHTKNNYCRFGVALSLIKWYAIDSENHVPRYPLTRNNRSLISDIFSLFNNRRWIVKLLYILIYSCAMTLLKKIVISVLLSHGIVSQPIDDIPRVRYLIGVCLL